MDADTKAILDAASAEGNKFLQQTLAAIEMGDPASVVVLDALNGRDPVTRIRAMTDEQLWCLYGYAGFAACIIQDHLFREATP